MIRDRLLLLALGSAFVVSLAAFACSSEEAAAPSPGSDEDAGDASPSDVGDAGADSRAPSDAAPDVVVDASPAPIVCETAPCAVEIAAGSDSACVRMSDGTVRCWGSNRGGELGRGEGAGTSADAPAPVVGLSDVTDLSGSASVPSDVYCARRGSGEGLCWGSNTNGVLGRVSRGRLDTRSSPTPEPVTDLGPVRAIFAGYYVSCATLAGDDVRCWGSNAGAQIPNQPGDGSLFVPTAFAVAGSSERLALADRGTVAITSAGLLSWGLSGERSGPRTGVLGREASTTTSPPAKIDLSHVSATAAAAGSACAIANGQVYCWGAGAIPDHDSVYPAPIGVGTVTTPALTVAVGPGVACATLEGGAAFCWGDNSRGQLGGGNFDPRRRPVRVEKLAGPAVRMAVMDGATCAILATGKVQCWGLNDKGQLGTGAPDAQPHLEPQNVVLTP